MLYICINRKEKLVTHPRSYRSNEALDKLFRLFEEETKITNDENGDLDELDFTVEESERVELDSDNETETVETESGRTSSW